MKKAIILIMPFVFISVCYSQSYHYRFDNLTIDNGLPHSRVDFIEQDKYGLIWFLTESGLVSYDGYNMLIYSHDPLDKTSVHANKVNKIKKMPDGRFLLISDQVNPFYFDPATGKAETVPLPDDLYFNALISKDSTIWVSGQKTGLIHYSQDYKVHKTQLAGQESTLGSLANGINCFYEDTNHNIWLGVNGGGLQRILPDGTLKKYPFLKEENKIVTGTSDFLNGSFVTSILQLDSNSLWLTINSGLVHFDIETAKFTHYRYKTFDLYNPSAGGVRCLFHFQEQLWCGTFTNGIMLFDLKTKAFTGQIMHNKYDQQSLVDNNIRSFFTSDNLSDGVLWIITESGISKLDLNQKRFNLYNHRVFGERNISFSNIRSVFSDDDYLLIGSAEHHGLSIISKTTGMRMIYSSKPGIPFSIGSGPIGTILRKPDGNYWISTWEGSVNILDPSKGSVKKWQAFHNDIGLEGWVFCSAAIDNSGNYWLGSFPDGLRKISGSDYKVVKTFRHIPGDVNSLSSDMIRTILHENSPEGEFLWIGTNDGLSKLNIKDETIYNYFKDNQKEDKLLCNTITAIYRAEDGALWLGLETCGLSRFDPKSGEIRNYTKNDGLPSNTVYAIYPDDKGHFWLSTTNGISRFNLKNERFTNYFREDGLQGNQFNWAAHFQDKDGVIYFGGPNGLTVFHPDEIKDNSFLGKVYFTSFYIKDKKIAVGEKINNKVLLPKNLNQLDKLDIYHFENEFSIEFASTHFVNPLKNEYQYMLKGYDKEWLKLPTGLHMASYANLPAGTYTFLVKSSNNDGLWNETPSQLLIIVHPPWWMTYWFKALLLATLVGIVLFIIWLRTQQLKEQRVNLEKLVNKRTEELVQSNIELKERQVELVIQNEFIAKQKTEMELMAQRIHEADQMKLNFFTNISHEFRTPLTLILNPIETLIENETSDNNNIEVYRIIQRNSERLLRLINQLLDMSEIEAGTLKLRVSYIHLPEVLKALAGAFEYRAKKQKIELKIIIDPKLNLGYIDIDKLEKILYNLLSNAFKFTQENGQIIVESSIFESDNGENYIDLKVSDTGIGIPANEINRIFERFYQVKNKTQVIGTGIGLALTRRLVENHKGEIFVESEEGKSTTFLVRLPISMNFYSDAEIIETVDQIASRVQSIRNILGVEESIPAETEDDNLDYSNKIKVLFVDDNEDMRKVIKSRLLHDFYIYTAENGLEGQRIAGEKDIDIIVSDLMMPVMDGFEFCKSIRSNPETDHLPFILLTAKANVESVIKGLSEGADDYITKPFVLEVLKAKIHNVINNKRRLIRHIMEAPVHAINENANELTNQDKFITTVAHTIEQQLTNGSFDPEELATLLKISKSTLYRKLKAISGQTVSDFVRVIQLRQAARKLLETSISISEIAYSVGFNHPAYFSRCFLEQYHCTPTEYREQKKG